MHPKNIKQRSTTPIKPPSTVETLSNNEQDTGQMPGRANAKRNMMAANANMRREEWIRYAEKNREFAQGNLPTLAYLFVAFRVPTVRLHGEQRPHSQLRVQTSAHRKGRTRDHSQAVLEQRRKSQSDLSLLEKASVDTHSLQLKNPGA